MSSAAIPAPQPNDGPALLDRFIPRAAADRVAWAVVAAAALTGLAALARYWGANPGHADRFLILVGAAWAAYTLAPGWAALPVRPRPVLGLPLILGAVLTFPLGCFLLAQIGPRTLLLWWLGAGVLAAAAGLVLARLGWPRLRAAAFPLLFPLFALPIPDRILNPLQEHLQDTTTTGAYYALKATMGPVGYQVNREGIVLEVLDPAKPAGRQSGKLRVEEACSGVRSVTALTAIAAFVAFLRGFGPGRGVALVLLAVPVVASVNVLRVVLCGYIQEVFGGEYVRDEWHEGLGFAMVLVGLALVLQVARLIGGEPPAGEPAAAPVPVADRPPARGGWLPAGVLAGGVVLAAAFGSLGQAADRQAVETAKLDRIGPRLGEWQGRDVPLADVVTDLLAPDNFLHRQYENNVGDRADLYVFFWDSGAAIKGYHHPDVCWGNRGFGAVDKWVQPVPVGGATVQATAREFKRDKAESVILYWTQEGRRVWTDDDEAAAMRDVLTSSTAGHRWVGDLLGLRQAEGGGPRLQAMVITDRAGETARFNAAELAGLLAAELYSDRVCPWAHPGGN